MQVLPVSPLTLAPTVSQPTKPDAAAGAPGFGRMLARALEEVNNAQVRADRVGLDFLTGRVQELHQVTIAMEEARIMMSLAVEVRNKIVEAYQEISRMQV
ncbi:flagellar hook-basal body complex protein FliE [Desulfofundulus thermosubterraneus]|uniref:Flagellar hook-basal body complex protein FliE n=1 Tax=Desulfofundulus thermosubterraneus DSM 16057 TaxID=1121432 RepID=A0A1M6FXR0_9FIRM|nr:flagellar hook-basal body complex protein FliE [Desulfofundulus thermosubterraneus]SHJ02483.1 flagellar hook-basal body complex protein FliE [Desulfofundulus thermosubterraneus DSM 16057]